VSPPVGWKRPALRLLGTNGNALLVLGAARKAIRTVGGEDAVRAYTAEAMSGDYDHLLQVTMQWCEVY
jgi:hypothetical protein